ncbi:hypothetical protein [Actinomycetospora soli]|uniref:hypothetical protein n=1 Tax=Actinomycetospora soli TaxID=2893887 RepID=UPI001E4104AD|nr:hypothetical protein [Actinomycetospora soli]MCD2191342.1 hypothetical protein [Actinomycetospora soli]
MPEGVVVVRDQALALARLEELVDLELWRVDKRTAWTAMAKALIHGMSWETGLVAGVTRAHLAERAGVGLRTVTSLLAWAQDVGLVVCVETGATAEFLGTDTNRAPSYVLTVPRGWEPPAVAVLPEAPQDSAPGAPVDTTCDPPASCVEKRSPWRDRGLNRRHDQPRLEPWPVYDRTETRRDRARAVDTFLGRAGLGGRVVRWRAVAMLGPWFDAGWSVVGLLHAVDHHPDRPDDTRGDAARSARDPLRVLGHRLTPWRGRLADLPTTLAAVDGHVRRTRLAATGDRGVAGGHQAPRVAASPAVRAAARAEVSRVLTNARKRVGPSS